MALQGTPPISLKDIQQEIKGTTTGTYTLTEAISDANQTGVWNSILDFLGYSYGTTTTTTTAPTYSITPDLTSINEGDTVTYTISTTNIPNGTTLYWTNSGTTVASDFTDSVNNGSITINNNTAQLTRQLTLDYSTEGNETIILELRTGSVSGTIVATATTVTVSDTTTTTTAAPTYAIDTVPSGLTSFDEGDTITFEITTTNIPNGTTLYWTTAGTVVAGDFTDNQISGNITINSNTAQFTRQLTLDYVTEGTDTMIMEVRTVSTSGTIVAYSSEIYISDTTTTTTTTTAAPTYSITPDLTSINEGDMVTYTITTTNIPDGTTLYWTNSGSTSASDFTDNSNNGSVIINTNTAQIQRQLTLDYSTEGNETIILELRTGSVTGTIVATATTVTVSDTTTTTTTTTTTLALNSRSVSYDTTTSQNACSDFALNITITVYIDGTSLSNSSGIYDNSIGTIKSPAGYYTDDGAVVWYWDGNNNLYVADTC